MRNSPEMMMMMVIMMMVMMLMMRPTMRMRTAMMMMMTALLTTTFSNEFWRFPACLIMDYGCVGFVLGNCIYGFASEAYLMGDDTYV